MVYFTHRPAPGLCELRGRLRETADAFFCGSASLLTPARVAAVRAAFGGRRLALAEAWAAIFSGDERADYELAGFREDVAAFRGNASGDMSADEALAFVAFAQ